MLSRKYEAQLYVLPLQTDVGFKVIDAKKLYDELSKMDDVTRVKTIKEMNNNAGYELVNYKLLSGLYKSEQSREVSSRYIVNDHIVDEKEYIKAYMKLLSK